jgi:hypothetical protein
LRLKTLIKTGATEAENTDKKGRPGESFETENLDEKTWRACG